MSPSSQNWHDWLDRYHPSADQAARDDEGGAPVVRQAKKLTEAEWDQLPRLDLHGYTVEEARRQVDAYLRQAWRAGQAWVIIIHGKGLHGEGVLRQSIRAYLQAHPLAGQLSEAPERWGEGG